MHPPVNTALGNHPSLSTLRIHTSSYLSSGLVKPCTHHKAPLYSHTSNCLNSEPTKPCTHHLTLHWVTPSLVPLYAHSSTHFQLPEFWTNEAMHTPLDTALGDHLGSPPSLVLLYAHSSTHFRLAEFRVHNDMHTPLNIMHWVTNLPNPSPIHKTTASNA